MPERHKAYYFEDGNVVFLVANTLFRVHKRLFTGCEFSAFTSLFGLPSAGAEGESDELPISLNGDSLVEFEALMRLLYPPFLDDSCSVPVPTFRFALRLALKYGMSDIQKRIVDIFCDHIDRRLYMGDQMVALQRVALMVQFSDFTVASLEPFQERPELLVALLNWYSDRIRSSRSSIGIDAYLKGCGFIDG